jgi:hypothetical protein
VSAVWSVGDPEPETLRRYGRSLGSRSRKPRDGTARKMARRVANHAITESAGVDRVKLTCECGWRTSVATAYSAVPLVARVAAVIATHRESPRLSGSHPFYS